MVNNFINIISKKFRIDGHYFIHGGFWLSTTQVVTVLAGLGTTSLFAHYLSENDYGTYRYLIGLAVILSTLSLSGIGQSIIQATSQKHFAFYREILKLNFFYSIPSFFISLCGALYYFYKDNHLLAMSCVAIALLQPLISIFQYTPHFLQGARRFKESATLSSISTIFSAIISILILFITQSIFTLFVTYLATSAITSIVSFLYYRPTIYHSTPPKVLQRYVSYAKHTSVRNIIANIAQRADSIVVFTQLGAAELAIYSIASVIPEQIKGSFKNLAALLLPKYASHENISALKQSIPKRSMQLLTIILLITIAYIIVVPYLFQLIFPKYVHAVIYTQIAALAFPTFVLFIPQSILQSRAAEAELYKTTLYGSLFQIIFLLFFVWQFGLLGAIVARVLSRYINCIINYIYVYKLK